MKKVALVMVCVLVNLAVQGQQRQFTEQLYGYMLGQFEDVPGRALGQPIDSGQYDQGFSYRIYRLSGEDAPNLIRFDFSPEQPETIWSIQVTGSRPGRSFRGLKLGDAKDKVLRRLGQPSRTSPLPEKRGERWEYDSANFSADITPAGHVFSFRIRDESERLFGRSAPEKIPSIQQIYRTLRSRDREKISMILAPDMEITDSTSTLSFEASWEEEIASDYSGIYSTLTDEEFGLLRMASFPDPDMESDFRLSRHNLPMHAYRFYGSAPVSEIVLMYRFGRYVIWEVKFR